MCGCTDGRANGQNDGGMDRPCCRGASSHMNMRTKLLRFHAKKEDWRSDEWSNEASKRDRRADPQWETGKQWELYEIDAFSL